jgi:hypothetical protein
MVFINNKYTIWYNSLISNAKNRTICGYTEKHHIIPSSLGGTNDTDNLVKLTAREHFICHLLLTKMTIGNARYKMIYALHMLSNVKNIGSGRYTPTSRLYEYAKKLFIESKDSIWTPEKRSSQSKKISNIMKNKFSNMTVEDKLAWVKNNICKPESYTPKRIENMKSGMKGKKKTKTPALLRAAEERKSRIRQNPMKCGDSNRGKTWKLVNGKRVWFTKEN